MVSLPSERARSVWRRTFDLGWPVAVQQTLNTLMRTVDILVTGFFSPVAVAAIGLADLYSRIPLRIGMGLGSGAIALSSQETGRGDDVTRDRAVTQALLIGALCGIPLVIVGLLFSRGLIGLLGAEADVAREGGRYLTIVFAAAPMRIVGFVGARALQGTGDTRTPMLINGGATGLNILLSIALGLGLAGAPRLGIVGVGIATAVGRTVEAVLVVGVFLSGRTAVSLVWPRGTLLARQLLEVSVPDIVGGLSTEVANFPFNSLVLLFGTEANAAYHIANRIYQQFTAPFFRAFRTVASVLVGQELGAGRPAEARETASVISLFSLGTLGAIGVLLFVAAEPLATLFTRDAATIGYATDFNRTFALSMAFIGLYFPFSGALKGAGDTRTPFYAGVVGSYVFLLGSSYLLAVTLGFGLTGVFAGIVLSYAARAVIVGVEILGDDWTALAARLIAEREAADE
ncbi:MATE family efflux transporter [Halobellus captivus]|uniref:MATE family efflux transporter n=1 Tax=Halobellus captivus TaxID=2592614 RepID=UPI001939D6DE|nr:MATE family efflux transporter [Halobellus captivus]